MHRYNGMRFKSRIYWGGMTLPKVPIRQRIRPFITNKTLSGPLYILIGHFYPHAPRSGSSGVVCTGFALSQLKYATSKLTNCELVIQVRVTALTNRRCLVECSWPTDVVF